MGFLQKIVLPGNQTINIDKYSIGLIESSYIEKNKAGNSFILKIDDYPNSDVTIKRHTDLNTLNEHFYISTRIPDDKWCSFCKEVKLIEDNSDDIDLPTNNLNELYCFLVATDNNKKVQFEFYNCTLIIERVEVDFFDEEANYIETNIEYLLSIDISEFLD